MLNSKNSNRFLRFLVLFAGLLSFWGWFQYDAIDDLGIAIWSSLYKTLQTFLFETGFDTLPVPVSLQIAVYLAPLSLAGTIFLGVISMAHLWIVGLYIRIFLKDHIILAGDLLFCTKLLSSDTSDFRNNKKVMLLASDAVVPDSILMKKNILIINGDMRKADVWKLCGIRNAKSVLISPAETSDMNEINKAIKLSGKGRSNELIVNYSLDTLEEQEVFSDSKSLFEFDNQEIRGFHFGHLTATVVVEKFAPHRFISLESVDSVAPHLIIDGFTDFTKFFIIEAAHLYHYPSMKNLQISLISDKRDEVLSFVDCQPGLRDVIDIEVFNSEDLIPKIHNVSENTLLKGKPTPYMVLVFSDSSWGIPERARQWRRFLTLSDSCDNVNLKFFISQDETNLEIFKSFENEWADLDFTVYGEEDFIHIDQIVDNIEVIDSIAYEINESYRQRFGGKEWFELTDREKEFNRRSARHLKIKLNLMGLELSDDLTLPELPIPAFTSDQKRIMAKVEHKRWNSEKYLDGFISGTLPNDKNLKKIYKNILRIHPDIRPFEELNEVDIAKDENTFEDLKVILTEVLKKKRLVKI